MLLYHGTTVHFEAIDLAMSAPGKDFGRGFYLSDNIQQAQRMADFKAVMFNSSPVVLCFDFHEERLAGSDLKCKRFDEYSLEWAEFVLENRKNLSKFNLHDYDYVYGPIANDKIGAQIRELMENNIDIQTFMRRIKYGMGITFQYCFCTEKAVGLLKRV